MPSGLQQIVEETGWQLSHGEKSRLFIARALLQRHRVVVLDESLAALDPEIHDADTRMRVAASRELGLGGSPVTSLAMLT